MSSDDDSAIDSIKLRALRGVWRPTYDSTVRHIHRWYSEKFHTPLHLVADLPLEDVLLNWFECHYEALEPEDKHNEALKLLETPEDRILRETSEKSSDARFLALTAETVAKQKAKKQLSATVADMKAALDKVVAKKPASKPMPEIQLPSPKPQESEEITLSFTDEPFEDDDPISPPPKGTK